MGSQALNGKYLPMALPVHQQLCLHAMQSIVHVDWHRDLMVHCTFQTTIKELFGGLFILKRNEIFFSNSYIICSLCIVFICTNKTPAVFYYTRKSSVPKTLHSMSPKRWRRCSTFKSAVNKNLLCTW